MATAPRTRLKAVSAPADGSADQNGSQASEEVGLPEMVTVTVARAYTLTLDTGGVVQYSAGVQEMQIDHAEHWWSRTHGGVTIYTKDA